MRESRSGATLQLLDMLVAEERRCSGQGMGQAVCLMRGASACRAVIAPRTALRDDSGYLETLAFAPSLMAATGGLSLDLSWG